MVVQRVTVSGHMCICDVLPSRRVGPVVCVESSAHSPVESVLRCVSSRLALVPDTRPTRDSPRALPVRACLSRLCMMISDGYVFAPRASRGVHRREMARHRQRFGST
jgi:hypothetical protein